MSFRGGFRPQFAMARPLLPSHIMQLFTARPPAEFKKPIEHSKCRKYDGIASLVDLFEEGPPPSREITLTARMRKEQRKQEKLEKHRAELQQAMENYKPAEDPHAITDPLCTLFVGRLSFETDEKRLKHEFEQFGRVKKAVIVRTPEGKSRGYGFVEFEKERDVSIAYKEADGRKIDGRRVVVDVERGRTVPNWLPRRLGGGLGGTRIGGKDENQRYSGRAPAPEENGRDRSRSRDRDRDRDREVDRDRERRDRDRPADRDRARSRDVARGDGGDMARSGSRDHERDHDRERRHRERRPEPREEGEVVEKRDDRDRERRHRSSRDDDRRERDRDRDGDRDRDRERRDRDRDREGRDRDRSHRSGY
eukprot:GILK01002766.1.p1 GENE.GILK01002766.1~~GILK01002766.1.p1  ORF type:complete len:365 (-),score=35.05 GILK01002766.1:169-1263(-)